MERWEMAKKDCGFGYRRSIPKSISLVVAGLGLACSAGRSWVQSDLASEISAWGPAQADSSVIAWVRQGALEAMLVEGVGLLVCILAMGLLAVGAEAFARWREQRATAAERLHARIATALRGQRLVKDVSLHPIIRMPLWGWGRATIEVSGHVPSRWLRKAVLRLAEQEAVRSRTPCTIRDRLTVPPAMERLAA